MIVSKANNKKDKQFISQTQQGQKFKFNKTFKGSKNPNRNDRAENNLGEVKKGPPK